MKQFILRLINSRVSRFAVLGVVNTVLDFVIYNILRVATHTTSNQVVRNVILNMISAGSVAVFSFFMNRKYVFKDKKAGNERIWLFFVVTMIGIFVVQQAIFSLVLHIDDGLATGLARVVDAISPMHPSHNFYATNIAKAVGTLGSMIWNFQLYKRVVFKETAGQK
jgi:putative flippase GtrA